MRYLFLVRQEVWTQIGSTRFRLLTLVASLLTLIAVTIATRDYTIRLDQYGQRFVERESQRETKDGQLMGWAVEPALRVLRRPAAESVLVRGLDATLPAYWDVSPAGVLQGNADPSIAQDSEIGAAFDVESVIRIVLALLALMLAIESVAGQRATGALQALMLQPISRVAVVGSKFAAAAFSLTAAVAAVLFSALVVLFLTAPALITRGLIWFAVLLGAVSVMFLLVMFSLGLVVASLSGTLDRATLAVIAIWTFVALVAPQLVSFGVRAVIPIPSWQTVERGRQSAFAEQLDTTQNTLGGELAGLTGGKYSKADITNDVRDHIDRLWRANAADMRLMVDGIDNAQRQATARQRRVMQWAARVTPGSLLVGLTTDLADTGQRTQERWESDVNQYEKQLCEVLFDDRPRLTLRVPADRGMAFQAFVRKTAIPVISDIPGFEPSVPGLRDRFLQERADLAVLIGFMFLATAGAVLAFPKPRL